MRLKDEDFFSHSDFWCVLSVTKRDFSRPKSDLQKDLRNDPGNYPNPVSITVPSSSNAPRNTLKEVSQLRNSIKNRATVVGKMQKSKIMVMPMRIKNEPKQIKHHFP